MKCVSCGTDNNLRDRTTNYGRCKNCNHHFAFDPKAGSRFTDMFFKRSLESISANSTLYYTPKQFNYFLEKRLKSKQMKPLGCLIFCVTIGFFIFIFTQGNFSLTFLIISSLFCWNAWQQSSSGQNSISIRRAYTRALRFAGFFILGVGIVLSFQLPVQASTGYILFAASSALGLLVIYLANQKSETEAYKATSSFFTQTQVNEWIERWTRYNTVEKMLPPSVPQQMEGEINSEITSYSFDRVVVCDNNAIAHFLVTNNFHFEHNCAILSIQGYPESIFGTLLEMLKRNSDLKVYAFHDATPSGVSLSYQLRIDPQWFGGTNINVYDLGLLPRHVLASQNMIVRHEPVLETEAQQLPTEVCQSLSAEELNWLKAGNYVELESFTPQRLLQVLSRGIAESRTESLNSIDSSNSVIYSENYSESYFIYSSESFG
ncbi:MAG: hypothetical protein AAFO04_18420 [Cyanobacteria bacterium J06592_8]